jgi:hypothetical protein
VTAYVNARMLVVSRDERQRDRIADLIQAEAGAALVSRGNVAHNP